VKVVQFGAGNIGRGFLGQLYWQAGYEIVYVDIDEELVALLNERRSYPLRLVDVDGSAKDLVIENVRAVSAGDRDQVARELYEADLAGTSVGADKLVEIAEAVAAGIAERVRLGGGPLNILLCENLRYAAKHMAGFLEPHFKADATAPGQGDFGLIDMVVGRMVPTPTQDERARDPLFVLAEPYGELQADRDAFKGAVPELSGMQAVSPIDAYFVRKLFTLNTAHAALAYSGYPRYEYIWQCVQDRDIHAAASEALDESCQGLIAEYGFDSEELAAYARDVMHRFANKALGDTVARVAADPKRKLRPEDRLVGPAQLCERHRITPMALARVIAAALAYDNPSDSKAIQMQAEIKAKGRDNFLSANCGIAANSELGKLLQGQFT
jgi:mannitol-1-phosphate 5-dehydrogenase